MVQLTSHFILTCGGRLPVNFVQQPPENAKVLAKVGNKTLLEHSLTAISEMQTGSVGCVVAVGPESVGNIINSYSEQACPAFPLLFAYEGSSLLDNIDIGLKALTKYGETNGGFTRQNNSVIVLSPDLPFVTGNALDEFLDRIPVGADISMPVILKDAFRDRYPSAPNKFNKTAEGYITLGSVALLTRSIIDKNRGLFQDAHNSRKSIGKLAGMLGPMVIIKLIFGRLSVHDIEERIGILVDGTVHAVLDCDPSLAYDIDNRQNIEYAEKVFNGMAE